MKLPTVTFLFTDIKGSTHVAGGLKMTRPEAVELASAALRVP